MIIGPETIESIILDHGSRGMNVLASRMAPGWCGRGADLVLSNPGTVLIGTGFPVGVTFETDGPVGAIALYQVLEALGSRPVMVCGPPLSRLLMNRFRLRELPILDREETRPFVERLLADEVPDLIVSIERPGAAKDGRYYNMRREDITDRTAKFDLMLEHADCPCLAVGDGGNEIGMGAVSTALEHLPIIPAVSSCDVLVIASVSNWGVYGVIAEMGARLGRDLFEWFNLEEIFDFLVSGGAVDGVTRSAAVSEDGFPLNVGMAVIGRLRDYIQRHKAAASF
ncbi:MAG: glutamate cyclase domain-containing protein [Desulfobacterales bacterium]